MSDAPSRSERLAARFPENEQGRTLVAALSFAVSGALVAAVIAGGWTVVSQSDQLAALDPATLGIAVGLPLAAGVGAAIAGAPLWFLVVERPDEPTLLRGGLVGAAVGVLAHPLMWLLFGLGAGVVMVADDGIAALASVTAGGVSGLLGVFLLFSVFGLVITGIVTVPVAAGTGVAVAHVRRTVPKPRERRPRHL